jgi:hypothetical protein
MGGFAKEFCGLDLFRNIRFGGFASCGGKNFLAAMIWFLGKSACDACSVFEFGS